MKNAGAASECNSDNAIEHVDVRSEPAFSVAAYAFHFGRSAIISVAAPAGLIQGTCCIARLNAARELSRHGGRYCAC
jgi:hypothetical protein